MPLLSVVICTYNRAELLDELLDTVTRQTLDPVDWEIVVVDNNSRDRTPETAETYRGKIANLVYVVEREQGLSAARNRGWDESSGAWVGYIDDDCRVPPEWLTRAKAIVDTRAPDVFGGPFHPFYRTPRPSWYQDAWGAYVLDDHARPLREDEYFYGGHMFFRRELREVFGGFDVSLGMTGERLAYGEEIVPQQILRRRRPRTSFWYDPELFVYHLVRDEKMRLGWIWRDAFVRAGYVHRVFRPDAPPRRRLGLLREGAVVASHLAADLVRGLWRDRKRYPYLRQYWAEHTVRYVRWLGTLREQARALGPASASAQDRSIPRI